MDERFMITIFIERIELQIAVEEQGIAGFAFRDNNALVRRALCVDDVVNKQRVLGERRQAVGFDKRDGEQNKNDNALLFAA